MSPAVRWPKLSADCTSSPFSASIAPSSVMFSIISYSSSSVTVDSASTPPSLAAALPSLDSRNETGVHSRISRIMEPAIVREKCSEYFFAMLLGSSSAKKKTITVSTSVAAATASVPHRRVTISVVIAEARMCDRLLPMSSVDSARSK